MSPANLAIVFGPNLLRPQIETTETMLDFNYVNRVIEILISHVELLENSSIKVSILFRGVVSLYKFFFLSSGFSTYSLVINANTVNVDSFSLNQSFFFFFLKEKRKNKNKK